MAKAAVAVGVVKAMGVLQMVAKRPGYRVGACTELHPGGRAIGEGGSSGAHHENRNNKKNRVQRSSTEVSSVEIMLAYLTVPTTTSH